MHYGEQANIVFYMISALFVVIFLGGLLGIIHLWRLGKEPSLNKDVGIFKWTVTILKASLLETQILEYGFLTWVSHMMIFWGTVTLLLLTMVDCFIDKCIAPSSEVYKYFSSGDGALGMAVWGDFWGLVLLGGLLIALSRRLFGRSETRVSNSDDWIALVFLLVIVVTGFFTEAVRLAVHPVGPEATYSFAVNWAVPIVKNFGWGVAALTTMFWIHGIISMMCIAYIPFSKFRHIIASPLVHSFVTAGNTYSKESWLKRKSAK